MRTLGVGGLAAVLAAGLAVSAAAAADEDAPPARTTWSWSKINPLKGKAEAPKPADAAEPAVPPPAPEVRAAARREREYNAYLRRLDACDRLMEVALANGDEEMQRQIEQLQERNWAVYQANTADRAPDEALLAKKLDTKGSGRKLLAPSTPARDEGARTANTRKEELP